MAESSPETDSLGSAPLQEAFSEIQSDFTNLEHLVDGLFDEIERLSNELDRKAADLAVQQELVVERERQLESHREEASRLTGQLESHQAELSEVKAELQEVKSLLVQHVEDSQQQAAQSESIRHQYESEAMNLSGEMVQKLTELEKERDLLERELDAVRSRNAELTELVSQQKQQLVHRQSETAAELKRLGALVESRFERISQWANEPAAAAADADAAEGAPAPRTAGDPVVTSVVAQLAKLQRHVTRRSSRDASNDDPGGQ